MRKLLILLVVFVVSGVSFAQEETKVNRSLSFYLDTFSGHLTQNEGGNRLFSGNEFEFGMTYSQNFGTVPWLSMWVKALVVTGIEPAYSESGDDYIGNNGSVFVYGYGNPRVQLGLNFAGHAIIAVDTRGLIAQEAYYSLDFGKGGSLTFIQILEFFAFPQAINTGLDGNDRFLGHVSILDLFALRMDYSVALAPGWTYRSKISFRFGGDTAEDFKNRFAIRWENQVVWSVTPSFYMWTQIRYHIANVASTVKDDHQVFLQAGLGYSFDFSDR